MLEEGNFGLREQESLHETIFTNKLNHKQKRSTRRPLPSFGFLILSDCYPMYSFRMVLLTGVS